MGHEGQRRARRGWGRWLGAGGMLVAAVLFHALAMTAMAHATADPPQAIRSTHALHARHASVPASAAVTRAGASHAPLDASCDADSCQPVEDCGVGLPAVLRMGGNQAPAAFDVAPGPLDVAPAVQAPPAVVDTVTTPVLSPGVRRALLQVFLI